MSENIVIALIAFAGTLIGSYFAQRRTTALVVYRLEQLENKGMVSKVVNGNGRANNYMINTNVAFWGKTINDTNHLDVFKNCPYIPDVTIKYRKTPKKNK